MDYAVLGKEPIDGDSPTGSDCRYEPEFETLQAEIDKLSSPTASGKVDWALVVKTAAGILQKQSKDLTVASYLAVGLVQVHQIEGLDQGVQVLSDLVQTHWDKLFPSKKRMRGRQGAFNWWAEKTEEVVEQIKVAPLPAELIDRIKINVKTLDELLVDKMPDPPLLRPVQRQIERLPVQKAEAPPPSEAEPAEPVEQPKAAPDPAPKPAASPAKTVPVEAPAAIESDQDVRKGVDSALRQLRKASRFMLQDDLKNPMAYRYRRLAAWAKLEGLPPNTDGATQIPVPAPQVVSELQALRDGGNWPALIQSCEQKVSQYIFWFDLSYMVAEGLKNLGAEYQKALSAVCQETAFLLDRFAGLENLTFADGTRFAETQTRKWLQSIRSVHGGGGNGGPSAGADDEPHTAVVQDALAMARKKRVVDAVSLLQDQMTQAVSSSRQLRWRLAIAQVLLIGKKSQLALPHIDQILMDIDTFHLETWDPALAVEGLTMAWKGYSAQAADAHKLRALEILGRIAKIDPSEALRLQK